MPPSPSTSINSPFGYVVDPLKAKDVIFYDLH